MLANLSVRSLVQVGKRFPPQKAGNKAIARAMSSSSSSSSSSSKAPYTLVLVRHGESTWNQLNKFTGWYDCPLSEKGHAEAAAAGRLIKESGLVFDLAYTSMLQRAIRTLWHTLEQTGLMYIPIRNTWQLNERHYGALQVRTSVCLCMHRY